jgi:hypothetical protein
MSWIDDLLKKYQSRPSANPGGVYQERSVTTPYGTASAKIPFQTQQQDPLAGMSVEGRARAVAGVAPAAPVAPPAPLATRYVSSVTQRPTTPSTATTQPLTQADLIAKGIEDARAEQDRLRTAPGMTNEARKRAIEAQGKLIYGTPGIIADKNSTNGEPQKVGAIEGYLQKLADLEKIKTGNEAELEKVMAPARLKASSDIAVERMRSESEKSKQDSINETDLKKQRMIKTANFYQSLSTVNAADIKAKAYLEASANNMHNADRKEFGIETANRLKEARVAASKNAEALAKVHAKQNDLDEATASALGTLYSELDQESIAGLESEFFKIETNQDYLKIEDEKERLEKKKADKRRVIELAIKQAI